MKLTIDTQTTRERQQRSGDSGVICERRPRRPGRASGAERVGERASMEVMRVMRW
jgi:hypothetical protein